MSNTTDTPPMECPPHPHNVTECAWPTLEQAHERIAVGRAQIGRDNEEGPSMSDAANDRPPGKAQGGMLSEEGRAAYWRMQWESAIGALSDLIAEHTETVEELASKAATLDRIKTIVSDPLGSEYRMVGEIERLFDADTT